MNTWLDGGFWGPHFRRSYIAELEALRGAFFGRVMPAFDGIASESEAAAQAEWDRLMSLPSDGNDDPGTAAEQAHEAGILHYQRLSNARQTMMNMMAVTLRHLLDQQMMEFHKRQVLAMSEESERTLHKDSEFRDRLRNAGVDVELFPSWKVIRELRLVANVVKHGEGDFKAQRETDFEKLVKVRAELFVPPDIRGTEMETVFRRRPRVERPAGGEDVYVDAPDLQSYFKGAVDFWNELALAVEAHSSSRRTAALP